MKKSIMILTAALGASIAQAESPVETFNKKNLGTLSGRLQSLTMHRDYDNGTDNYSTTLGIQLNYHSPVWAGLSFGATYNGAGVLDAMDAADVTNPGDGLLANGRINVLTEAYVQYNLEELGLTNSTLTVGRQSNNGEVFRSNNFRHKDRAIEAVRFETGVISDTKLVVGHAWRLSNLWSTDTHPVLASWNYQDFNQTFNTTEQVDGVTWVEAVNTSIDGLEVALFDAHAYDALNLVGLRTKLSLCEKTALLGYYRNETDTGSADDHCANAYGLSLQQKVGKATLEGGYFGVGGDNLKFHEANTGINHSLGSSLMVYAGQYNGGADTAYLKAVGKIKNTTLYGLYNYTIHDTNNRHAQEFNLVVKQQLTPSFSVAFKGGVGHIDGRTATVGDTTATDSRLFLTYNF